MVLDLVSCRVGQVHVRISSVFGGRRLGSEAERLLELNWCGCGKREFTSLSKQLLDDLALG